MAPVTILTSAIKASLQHITSGNDVNDEVSTLQSNIADQPSISIDIDDKFDDKSETNEDEFEGEKTKVSLTALDVQKNKV